MIDLIRSKNPLVHCMTNYVTVNDCANALLAVGASPIMSDEVSEAEELGSVAAALVINIGTATALSAQAMLQAAACAKKNRIPVVLDPVGAGASVFRRQLAAELLQEGAVSLVRGNSSEIKALSEDTSGGDGVDAKYCDMTTEESLPQAVELTKRLAVRTGAAVAMSGAIDVITDGRRALALYNGDPLLTRISGSGCMLSALSGAFLAVADDPFAAARCASSCLAVSGELAAAACRKDGGGTATFRMLLLDALSRIDDAAVSLKERSKSYDPS